MVENGHLPPDAESTEAIPRADQLQIIQTTLAGIEAPVDTSNVLIEMEEKIYPVVEVEEQDNQEQQYDDQGQPIDTDPTGDDTTDDGDSDGT